MLAPAKKKRHVDRKYQAEWSHLYRMAPSSKGETLPSPKCVVLTLVAVFTKLRDTARSRSMSANWRNWDPSQLFRQHWHPTNQLSASMIKSLVLSSTLQGLLLSITYLLHFQTTSIRVLWCIKIKMYYDKYQAKMLSFKQKHDPYQAKICLEVGKYALSLVVFCFLIFALPYSPITEKPFTSKWKKEM